MCTAIACNRPVYSRGLCEAHYARARKHGLESINDEPLKVPRGKLYELFGPIGCDHPFYRAWQSMWARCRANHPRAKDYFERGIKVEEPGWACFLNFYGDMWETWEEELTLDRRDNDKGYSHLNCRWATYSEQNGNKQRSLP